MSRQRRSDLRGGEGIESWIQPHCGCGWVGTKHYAHNDYQHTNAREQFENHKCKVSK